MTESTAHFEAASGDTVFLRLEREGVGGYVWSIGQLPPALALAGEPVRETDQSGGAIGGGAVLVAGIVAQTAGRHQFICELRRPWGERDLAERRTVTVEVG